MVIPGYVGKVKDFKNYYNLLKLIALQQIIIKDSQERLERLA